MGYRIGIDVGGTNTDAVLLDESMNILSKYKAPTSKDVMSGIYASVAYILDQSGVDKSKVTHAMLGTTHCTNAIVERKNLNRVGVIRIGSPATTTVPPLFDWPADLLDVIGRKHHIVSGGYEYNGEQIVPVNEKEVQNVVNQIKNDVDAIAVVGVYSPSRHEQELKVQKIIRQIAPELRVSLSYEIGSIGLLERENATVLNAALTTVIRTVVQGFKEALLANGLDPTIFFGQNDGTLISTYYALAYPIFTIGCGPTNSIRGAVYLSGLERAMILDIGGTTTDIGVVKNGFPRESSVAVEIGGVRTNFRMPDILSLGIGGGTIIKEEKTEFKIGPDSVGHELTLKGKIFGGKVLTATDVAVGAGIANIDQPNKEILDKSVSEQAHKQITQLIEDGIDRMKTNANQIPVVLSGGGSILIPESLEGAAHVVKPDHYEVANAIGAAIGDISGETEKVYSLDERSYDDVIEEAKQLAIERAKKSGANPDTIRIVSIEDIPLAYMPGNAIFVKVKAVGELSMVI
ncbi:hydantoinase/oxoprolinase N-terminal domain-containing protein [Lentibacillus salinarum]|uniref:Hydantoinase/oxoprolinase N-terminal domain-containing protein n=1 Tax=Lentibacillus salinarum TaxID=446820 RepID=A0ABW3ZYL4_9BACI